MVKHVTNSENLKGNYVRKALFAAKSAKNSQGFKIHHV